MNKVQQYKYDKWLATQPTMWFIKSSRDGVETPMQIPIHKIENTGRKIIYQDKTTKNLITYYLDHHLIRSIDLVEGESFVQNEGCGTGFGDLWAWSHFYTLDEKLAKIFFEEETERVKNLSSSMEYYSRLRKFSHKNG